MSDDIEALKQRIAQLEAQLEACITPINPSGDLVRVDNVANNTVNDDKVVEPRGSVNVSDHALVYGPLVGLNLGRIIYGHDPEESERQKVVIYLQRISNKLRRLTLRGLDPQHIESEAGISLGQVYIELATLGVVEVARGSPEELQHYFQDGYRLDPNSPREVFWDAWRRLKPAYNPFTALPSKAIVVIMQSLQANERWSGTTYFQEHTWPGTKTTSERSLSHLFVHGVDVGSFLVFRSQLVKEAINTTRVHILLGSPGSGKSTFLRHYAWSLAQSGLGQPADASSLSSQYLSSRHEIQTHTAQGMQQPLLPLFVPLRKLAGRLAAEGSSDTVIYTALRDEMKAYGMTESDDLLRKALHRGAVLLLFDGLDEVPVTATAQVADRLVTIQAIRDFLQVNAQVRAVITCRTHAFDDQLRRAIDWQSTEIAPFTRGQMHQFISAFYCELCTAAQAEQLEQTLTATTFASARLSALAATPLLLTMMALVLYHDGSLPRDRPLLYERILELLLGQWDKVSQRPGLAEAIGDANWDSDRLRPLLDELAYMSHANSLSDDMRGRLKRRDLRDALIAYFEAARLPDAWEIARRCLTYFEQRSGLLIPDTTDTYVFAHLTLQEHCAGRYILLSPDAANLVMQYRTDDRWREPIFLGLGVVQKLNPALVSDILARLLHRREGSQRKPIERWYRDLILAGEIGEDRDWSYLRAQRVDVDRLQDDVKTGLVALLADKNQPLPIAERVRAGFLLGELGDPRFPITIEEWRHAIASAGADTVDGYFCPIPFQEGEPAHCIARYPITNAQWSIWGATTHISPRSHIINDNFNRPNQPVAGVNWSLAVAFCTWLSQQTGTIIRLPSEGEWEAAARGRDGRRYPWGNTRERDRAATKEDHNLRAWPYTIPVGCYPAGASAVGALDMAGNIWEWTSDLWQPDRESQHLQIDEQQRVLRGGGYLSKKNQTLTTARIGLAPSAEFDNGFRIVLEIRN